MVFVQETEGRTLFSVNKIQTFQILQLLTNLKHFGAKIQSNLISIFVVKFYISKTTKSRLTFPLFPMHGLSFKATGLKLCMQPRLMRGASEAAS